ncbi:PEP-CTERM sorting domain-containing protein [Propionivibrio sp.]|uniref:PEP-CTERM sorting domain-containing protein n=1 Tax=Propionivibrio sp. TaxID=2212460 RepID=UPI003BF1387D
MKLGKIVFAQRTISAAVMSLGLVVSGGALAGSFTFSTTAEWATGVLTNTNGLPPPATGNGHVRLDEVVLTPFNHIWVAMSGRGTAVRINTDHQDADKRVTLAESAAGNGAVYGEYRTAPQGQATDPSRTTVDKNGDVWVGNRAQANAQQGGSVVKLSATPTGTTSTGVWNGSNFNVLDWNNAGGADTLGGKSTAADSAVSLYVRTPGTANRTLAVDANNDVWVGGYNNKLHQKLDGTTGVAIGAPVDLGANSGYGGLIDGNGVLWSAGWANGSLSRYDPATGISTDHNVGGGSYGLAVDSKGNVYNGHLNNAVSKLDSAGNLLWTKTYAGGNQNRGIAVTPDDNVWIANSGTNTVSRLNSDGILLQTITVEMNPMGISVDSKGKVWAVNYGSGSASRIDPATNLVDLTVELGGGNPYNYSDMTGTVVSGTTSPSGTWRKVMNGGVAGADWDEIFYNEETEGAVPGTTGLLIEVRAADLLGDLTSEAWTTVISGNDVNLTGKFLEVRATLTRPGNSNLTPVLSDLRINFAGDNVVPEPGTLALLAAALISAAGLRRRQR